MAGAVLIEPFVVAPGEDEAFLAAAEALGGTLYRALRPDAEFRFVHVERVALSEGATHEVVHEEGAPDGAEGVTVIELFDVAADDFLAAWLRVHAVLTAQRGYLGTRLHRASGGAGFRFVAVTRWSSPLMVHRAGARPEFTEAAAALPAVSHRALYQVVRG